MLDDRAVKVHGNLHKRCLSVVPRKKPYKTQHYYSGVLMLTDCEFRVSEKAHERIQQTNVREVCARVWGIKQNWEPIESIDEINARFTYPEFVRVSYNPKEFGTRPYFYTAVLGDRIDSYPLCYLVNHSEIDSPTNCHCYIHNALQTLTDKTQAVEKFLLWGSDRQLRS